MDEPDKGKHKNVWIGAGVGLAVAAVVAGVAVAQSPKGATTATPSPVQSVASQAAVPSSATPSVSLMPTATTSASASASPSASSTPSRTPTPSASPTESATESPSPSASASSSPSATPPSSGVVTSLDKGSYVALFKWMSKSKYTAAEAAEYAASVSGKGGYTVVAIDGDKVGGLNKGNYGIGVDNLSGYGEAKSACKAMGFKGTATDCWARQVQG